MQIALNVNESVYATLQSNHKKSNFLQGKKIHINMFILLKKTYQMFMFHRLYIIIKAQNHRMPLIHISFT